MNCGHERHHGGRCGHGHGRHHGGRCDCGGQAHIQRRFWTKEEKIARLEQYLEELQMEARAVEEHIAKMKGG